MTLRLICFRALALASALAVSACAGNGYVTPSALGAGQPGSAALASGWASQLVSPNAQPNVTCPRRYKDCVQASKSKSVELLWCYGPVSDPCSRSDAGKVKWSGYVCLAKGRTCRKPIKQLTASWSGPFKCKAQYKCKGTFELDTLKPGPGLKETKKYLYKQDVHICKGASCEDEYIGISVGP